MGLDAKPLPTKFILLKQKLILLISFLVNTLQSTKTLIVVNSEFASKIYRSYQNDIRGMAHDVIVSLSDYHDNQVSQLEGNNLFFVILF